ncbi:MAG: beta-ketoacyl synthase N-terminal-like domain-containing protein [Byssovorax sp.]
MDIVVTGIGAALPGCRDRLTLWNHLRDGESQLKLTPIQGIRDVHAMGRVDSVDAAEFDEVIQERFFVRYPWAMKLYLASVLRGLRDARLATRDVAADRIGLFSGTSRDSFAFWQDRLQTASDQESGSLGARDLMLGTPGQSASIAAALLKIEGPVSTFSSSCSSGAVAVGHAFREIAMGGVDVAVATGHDAALTRAIYQMYSNAQLLSEERHDPRRALRPYGGDSRNVFGEGAITLVLERREHAERRGAPILAAISGYAYGNNGQHPTDVDVSGDRPTRMIEGLLERAAVSPERVGVVVGHGNGVPASDTSERNYMRRVFKDRAREVPLVSVKPIYGHLLGASSALNVAAAVLMVHHGHVVPTLNAPPATVSSLNHQSTDGKDADIEAAIAMSFGIGGHNTGVLVRRAAGQAPAAP